MPGTDLSSWTTLWQSLRARGSPEPWHRRLTAAYNEAARHYHTLQHLEACLAELQRVYVLAQQPVLMETALWFHDAVYDPYSANFGSAKTRRSISQRYGVSQLPESSLTRSLTTLLCAIT